MIGFKEIISILLNPMTSFNMDAVTKVITVVNNDKKPENQAKLVSTPTRLEYSMKLS